eukprot:jgi/Undpi1/10959/HiC_scaffold_30.g13260.m1
MAKISATASSSREVATACADQVANFDIILRQFVENNSGRVAAARDDGDAQERQRQKVQLTTEMATWNKSFVGEAIHVTANVASQLRSFSSFDVKAYGPRVDGPIGHSLMVADRLDLSRLAVVAIISVGLSPGVADDLPCLARVNALGDAFTVAVMGLRAHTFSNYSMMSVPEAHAVLGDMVNRDIALWAFELLAIETPGPDEKPNLPPSRGNNNPAVLKYDPTGLRSTMSATEKARQESVQKYMPTHNVKPFWWHTGVDHVAEAQAKGLPPPPGRRMQWDAPPSAKLGGKGSVARDARRGRDRAW